MNNEMQNQNNEMANNNQPEQPSQVVNNGGQTVNEQNGDYNQNYNPYPKKSGAKKIFIIIGCIFLGFIFLGLIIFFVISASSEKLVCKSPEGNITIMYNDETLTGYTAKGISYDLDGQKDIAEQIGVEAYLEQFKTWFSTNTSGNCE